MSLSTLSHILPSQSQMRLLQHKEVPDADDCVQGGFDFAMCVGFFLEPEEYFW
jgi:hypothetical protein